MYQTYANHIPNIYLQYHVPNIYQPQAKHIPTTYQTYTYLPQTKHMPTTYSTRPVHLPHNFQKVKHSRTWECSRLFSPASVCFILVVRCPKLEPSPHTTKSGCVSGKDYNTFGDVCSFFCDPGYFQVNGSSKRRCGADGNWSGVPLECQSKAPCLSRSLSPGQTVLPTRDNPSQVFNLARVGYRLATHWLELAWIWSLLNLTLLACTIDTSAYHSRLSYEVQFTARIWCGHGRALTIDHPFRKIPLIDEHTMFGSLYDLMPTWW